MGAGQSKGGAAEAKTSYYELLGVARQASQDEIKKGYRRKALELHPDRNHGREKEATTIFAEVQGAYEVLSDAQERAWYDSHESAILRGDGQDETPTYQNVRVTTADDLARLVRKFNSNVEFSDSPSGFFGFIRDTFTQLAKEEDIAANWENQDIPDYPTFGHKDDDYEEVVKRFYATWSSFSTVKSFAWKDRWKPSDAPDRKWRRRMERENIAFRQEGIKEFNDAVRSLVAFIRKRDPRYVPSTQSEEERQKVLRDAAAAQAARARAANAAKLEEAIPDWSKSREAEELEESESEEEVEEEVFECVACNKLFKSEKQWETHEKSKKHQKAVYALQKTMRKQNAHLDLDDTPVSSGVVTPAVQEEEKEPDEAELSDDVAAEIEHDEARVDGHDIDVQDDESDGDVLEEEQKPNGDASKPASEDESDSDDSEYAPRETIRSRLQSLTMVTPTTTISESTDEGLERSKTQEDAAREAESQSTKPKMGKAAQKRAKKAAATATATSSSEQTANNSHTCERCNAGFPSKTRLFQHIKDHGHAAPKPVTAAAAGKGKRKPRSKLW